MPLHTDTFTQKRFTHGRFTDAFTRMFFTPAHTHTFTHTRTHSHPFTRRRFYTHLVGLTCFVFPPFHFVSHSVSQCSGRSCHVMDAVLSSTLSHALSPILSPALSSGTLWNLSQHGFLVSHLFFTESLTLSPCALCDLVTAWMSPTFSPTLFPNLSCTLCPTLSPSALWDLVTTWTRPCPPLCLPLCLPLCPSLCLLVFWT